MSKKIVLGVALILLVAMVPGKAGAEDIKLQTELNFGGAGAVLHQYSWNRLKVTVSNSSAKDLQGTLVLDAGAEYTEEIFVEAGKNAEVSFYLPPGRLLDDGRNLQLNSLDVRLLGSRGKEVVQSRVVISSWGMEFAYVGVLGRNPGNFSRLTNVLDDVGVTPGIGPEDLDNQFFAQNLKAIIVSNPETVSFTPAQQNQLRRWVEQGGILILGGGSGWQNVSAIIPDDLQPVRAQGVTTVSGAEMAELHLPVPPEDIPYTIATGEVLGSVLMTADSAPLLVRKTLGRGAVLWSALDLEEAPFDNPANVEAFWDQVFMRQPSTPAQRDTDPWAVNSIFNRISQDTLASALSPGKIFLLLLLYIVLVGPVNWLVLRKLDRREWAWLTIPMLSLLFTVGAFSAGRIGRGSDRILYQLNFVDVYSENLAGVRSHSGVFIPKRGRFTITSPAPGLIPLEQNTIAKTSGGQPALEFTNPPLWSVARFYGADFQELPGAFAVRMEYSGQRIQAEITNKSGRDLFDSYIRFGRHWYSVGPLEAGETVNINAGPGTFDFDSVLKLYSVTPNHGGWYNFEGMLPSQPILFVGFGDAGLLKVEGTGATVALDIWTQALENADLDFPPGPIDIRSGELTPAYLGNGDSREWGGGGEYHLNGPGSCDLEFTLPAKLDYSQGVYRLNMPGVWGDGEGTVEVYNYSLEQWQEISSLESMLQTPDHSIVLSAPQDHVRDNRLVVRVNYEGMLVLSPNSIDITIIGGMIHD